MFVAFFSQLVPVLEQPSGSVMPKAEPLRSVLAYIGARKVTCWHGAFGGESAKPLQLWSPAHEDLKVLWRKKPTTGMRTLVSTDKSKGVRRYSGVHRMLKGSQAYSSLHLLKYDMIFACRLPFRRFPWICCQWCVS